MSETDTLTPEWLAGTRKRRAAYMRKFRADNPEYAEKMREYRKAWRELNPDQHKEAQRINRQRCRIETLSLLGGECARCGFTDWRALQIDHIDGGGLYDSRTKQNPHFLKRWVELHLEEAKATYQVLCANCNWIKRHEQDEFGRSVLGSA